MLSNALSISRLAIALLLGGVAVLLPPANLVRAGEPAAGTEQRSSDHWSFRPVQQVEPPHVDDSAEIRNPIDAFIVNRLRSEGLIPSQAADKATLIRRVTLDLTGLPPTVAEVDAFLSDKRGDAYERLVDRLLSSPHYGERWGRHWLDLARYADSNGYTIDSARSIWKYRDWVIEAFNRDLPFDQFTIEQMAGDLLPSARIDQIVATGFHRNTMVNEEGGTDDEQFRVEAVADRVATTGVVFLGLTLGCARCHDHKYDPISQREFFQLFAILNNTDEPTLPLPTDHQAKELAGLEAQIKQEEEQLAQDDPTSSVRQIEWEKSFVDRLAIDWLVVEADAQTASDATVNKLDDQSFLVSGSIPFGDEYIVDIATSGGSITAIRLEALPHASLPADGPGLSDDGGFVLSEFSAIAKTAEGKEQPLTFSVAHANHSPDDGPIGHAIDSNVDTGWRVTGTERSGAARTAIFVFGNTLSGADVESLKIKIQHSNIRTSAQLGRFRLSISDADFEVLKLGPAVRNALTTPADKRTEHQRLIVQVAFQIVDPKRTKATAKIAQLKGQKNTIDSNVVKTLVMRERDEPRATHIHLRGDFLDEGAEVESDVPEVLPAITPRGEKIDRLDLARWLVTEENPLTARVTVNRIWQRYFGRGLVATENDFGTQGEPPTHPELLDWLSYQLITSGWKLKSLHRLILTSATYRQSSQIRRDLATTDPYNRLLGRQQRLRLEAESIRDSALAVSGLLSPKIGGPSVYPPQPEGIYHFTQVKRNWDESEGADRYRRGMYTHLWRSSPYPFLKTFDVPEATVACTRRARSNTPLQALTLANDAAFFEFAQGFAAELLREEAGDDGQRLRMGFRRCLAREATTEELAHLMNYLKTQEQQFDKSTEDAASVAPDNRPKEVDVASAAAWTMVARVMLNLDEFITRE